MIRKPDEDLFKDTTMTFGEHLEELRTCLIRAVAGLAIGFLLGMYVADVVVAFIKTPLEEALQSYYKQLALDRYQERFAAIQATGGLSGFDPALIERLVYEESLLPENVYLQSDDIFRALKDAYPGALASFSVPTNPGGHMASRIGPLSVVAADLLDPPALAQSLVAASASAEGSQRALRHVWELLGTEQQDPVKKVAGLAKDQVTADDKAALATALSSVLGQPLYDAESMSSLELSEQGRHLRERLKADQTLTAAETLRLDRLVLEALFPQTLAATHADLIAVDIWRPIQDDPRLQIKALNAQEAFMIWVKASLVVGLVLSSPWVFYQLWIFVAAGLYPHEKRYIHVFLPFSLGLFFLGAAVAFLFVFRPVLDFLFSFNKSLGIDPDPRISEWLGFVLLLPVGFGVSFQLPLVMLFLQRIGVFDVKAYLEKWRVAVLVIFVVAMVLTPADPYSMMLMAGPLTVLYFGGVLLCKYMPIGRNPFDG